MEGNQLVHLLCDCVHVSGRLSVRGTSSKAAASKWKLSSKRVQTADSLVFSDVASQPASETLFGIHLVCDTFDSRCPI